MTPNQLIQIADIFRDAALFLMPDGTVQATNRAAARLFGGTDAILGRPLTELTATPQSAVAVADYLRQASRAEEPLSGNLELQVELGKQVYCTCSALGIGEGSVILRLSPTGPSSGAADLSEQIDVLNEEIRGRSLFEQQLYEQKEWLQVTLASIGDAVVATDKEGVVTYMNAMAEKLTGWPAGEATGKLLEEVFQIVNEFTRQHVENPVVRVLREGVVVGLANHTLLIARDGTERPIADSAAPIRYEDGAVSGVVLIFRDVTLEKQAEESQRWLAAIVESSDDAILSKTLEGIVTTWNKSAEQLYGYTAAEIVGKPISTIVPPDRLYELAGIMERIKRGGPIDHFETVRQRKDGTLVDVSVTISPVSDGGGRLMGASTIARDIRERKQTQEQLAKMAEELRLVTDSLPALVSYVDAEGYYRFNNLQYSEWFGIDRDEIQGKHMREILGVAAYERVKPFVREVLTGKRVQYEEEVPYRGGTRFIRAEYVPDIRPNGQVAGYYALINDLTERRRAEQTLRENEERLRLALEAGRMGTWEWNLATNAVTWSPGLEVIHGLAPGTFAGTFDAFLNDVYPEDRERLMHSIQEAIAHCKEHHVEYRIVWADGSQHWVEGRGSVLCDQHGKPQRMTGVCIDIDQRKRSEHTTLFLADASATLATLVDYQSTLQKVARLAVPFFADWCAIDMLDDDGKLQRLAVAHIDPTKVELAHEVYRRYPTDRSDETGTWKILRTGDGELIPEITDELLEANTKSPELLAILQQLGLRSYIGVPLNVRGQTLGVITFISAESGRIYDTNDLAVAEDLAHRAAVAIENARLYRAVREADRRKDEFLALLGHELRNPLAPISHALHLLKLPQIDDATREQAREMLERQVQHMVRLVDDLLDMSRIMRGKVELRREPIDILAVISRAVETAKPVIDAESHRLEIRLSPEPLQVEGDLLRLSQVVANLLHNAAKYTESGGQITLSTTRVAKEAEIRVSDTGIGLSPEALPKIFEMFYQAERRTKDSQGGLGIGLSLVRSLVESHGGRVEAYSPGPGMGSEFVVYLPLMPSAVDLSSAADPQREVGLPLAARRVLVVDDNVDAADSLAMLLRLMGQDTLVAYDGAMAITLAEENLPSVAFVDLGMPRIDGYELARRFRAHPVLKDSFLIAITGWGQPEDQQRTREAGFNRHLVKPVELSAVRQTLQDLIGELDSAIVQESGDKT